MKKRVPSKKRSNVGGISQERPVAKKKVARTKGVASTKRAATKKIAVVKKRAPANLKRRGRFVTFYSYKGGTGRSMAVANVAWILAGQGKRVMVIDWDLEAPGLHRYFHPFIEDKELSSSLGLIDFFVSFVEGARASHRDEDQSKDDRWFDTYTNLLPYAFSLDWKFPRNGTLDFVPAGQQGAGYGVRVTKFDWDSFYDELGGGVFLETMKERLRGEYDYILIDSRTGISDTSGICTVQMPDDLVVCFTLNNQSIQGAAAVADSAFKQRLKPSGQPGLRVWPVPTRVELAEKDKLELARETSQQIFQQYLLHLSRIERRSYWGRIEVPYDPYFAYEEVLASFADRRHSKLSVLDSMITLTRHLANRKLTEPARIPETLRRKTLNKFARSAKSPYTEAISQNRYFYLSYVTEDSPAAERLNRYINEEFSYRSADYGSPFMLLDKRVLRTNDEWPTVRDTVRRALGVLILVTPSWLRQVTGSIAAREALYALESHKPVIPLFMGTTGKDLSAISGPLRYLSEIQGVWLKDVTDQDTKYRVETDNDLFALGHQLERLALDRGDPKDVDPEDPQKGLWGGRWLRNGRALKGKIKSVNSDWFEVTLEVSSKSGFPLVGSVEFHLHPTFEPPIRRVDVKKGKATITIFAWGAFTLGALADDGKTPLELDLSKVTRAPRVFRER